MNIELDQEERKKCNHRFDIKDLTDFGKEPKCKKCSKTLKEASKEKRGK